MNAGYFHRVDDGIFINPADAGSRQYGEFLWNESVVPHVEDRLCGLGYQGDLGS